MAWANLGWRGSAGIGHNIAPGSQSNSAVAAHGLSGPGRPRPCGSATTSTCRGVAEDRAASCEATTCNTGSRSNEPLNVGAEEAIRCPGWHPCARNAAQVCLAFALTGSGRRNAMTSSLCRRSRCCLHSGSIDGRPMPGFALGLHPLGYRLCSAIFHAANDRGARQKTHLRLRRRSLVVACSP